MLTKQCKKCENTFQTRESKTVFCSKSCSAKYNNAGVNRWASAPRNCKNCNVDISSRKDKRDKYCSFECSNEYKHKQSKYYGLPFGKCKECDKTLSKHTVKYCSLQCSNRYSARLRYGSISFDIDCQKCGISFKPANKTVTCCSVKCSTEVKRQEKIDAWLKDPDTGSVKGRGLSNTIRQYLIEQAGFVCSKPDCSWGEYNPYSGNITLEIEHIDGDCMNNHPDNLEVLCPNHHSVTPTYRALNKGKSTRNRK